MNHYRLFGGTLRADIDLPELESVDPADPTWTLCTMHGTTLEVDAEHLGTDAVNGAVDVHMYRRADGLRLVFDDTGCFDISADGGTITWTRGPGVSLIDARADLTSRVMAAALYAAGTLSLHGSAVVLETGAIGFMAPKYHGKSTLALALVRSGAKLLTDDTLPVLPGSPTVARPGLHATRLWPDAAERVGLGEMQPPDERAQAMAKPKQLYSALPEEFVSHDSHPLHALYLLSPTRSPRRDAPDVLVWRTRLSPIEAPLVMIAHSKLAPLLTKSESPSHFRRAAELAARVPVYRLNVVRDLDRLDEVVSTIRSWHEHATAGIS